MAYKTVSTTLPEDLYNKIKEKGLRINELIRLGYYNREVLDKLEDVLLVLKRIEEKLSEAVFKNS